MQYKVPVYAIAAMDEGRAIGIKGGLPWHLPQDLKRFAALTKGHSVLMGRKTFDSLPEKYKPLPQRLNVVLSKQATTLPYEDTLVLNDTEHLEHMLRDPRSMKGDILWIIGGEQIYRATEQFWDRVYITRVSGRHEGDAFFPSFEENFKLTSSEPADGCAFEVYERAGTQ